MSIRYRSLLTGRNGTRTVTAVKTVAPVPVASTDVAIIIPCHNYGRFLEDCLRSVIGQSHSPAEVIVVDDGSIDDTPQVAALFKDRGVRYLRIDARNPHEARRAGIEATTASLVCCVDADDQLAHDYLKQAVPLFRDARVGLAWSPIQEFQGSTRSWNPTPGDINKSNWIHAGAVVRRSAIERSGAFNLPNEAIREDYETWRRILNDGWQTARNPVTYLYRRHAASRSSLVPKRIDRVVVACYWTTQPDPQRAVHIKPNCWAKVAHWVLGIQKHGLRGVILHDDLSPEFVAKCAQYGVECIKQAPAPDGYGNTWRYFAQLEWLRSRDVATVFFTDLFDVRINADPFSMLRLDFNLWVGNEPQQIGESKWMLNSLTRTFGDNWPQWMKERQILNCGNIGGFRAPLLQLFQSICQQVEGAKEAGYPVINDMPFFNRVVYCETDCDRVWAKGAPLHSVFKAYDMNAPVAFVHK
jgi:glycosyltransferase involved in cell wall biosynthesis